jgi:glycosyltransferase involved in cell wall biosynthesis
MGGAHKMAYELFRGQRQRGHESFLAVGEKLRDDPQVFEIPNNAYRKPWARFWRASQTRLNKEGKKDRARLSGWVANLGELGRWLRIMNGFEDFDFPATRHLLEISPGRPEILHLHNLHGGYFDLRSIAELSRQLPIVFTLHDEWAYTGHCSYTLGCDRWEIDCAPCPDLSIYPALRKDGAAGNRQRKLEIYSRTRLYVSASSRWLMERAERSALKPGIVEGRVIPYGIDLKVFRPGDRQAARRQLDLPQQAQVILFVANKTYSNRFKDYKMLEDAVARIAGRLNQRETILLCLGEEKQENRRGSAVFRFAGFESDPRKVATFYQASDLYLHAAKAESFGLVIAEAQACGVPVVATDVNGIPEALDDGRTGYLVPPEDSEAMAERASQLLRDDSLRAAMGKTAIEYAGRNFDLERRLDDYLNWYAEIIKENESAKNLNCYSVV